MRIAWFTPFNKKSAIGRYSKSAALALSKRADVDLFLFEKEGLHSTSLRKVYYEPEKVLPLLKNYDMCIYNMGDHSGYHASIYEVMRKKRGVIILHDVCLHNFFLNYYIHNLGKREEYKKIITRLYGEKEARKIWDASNLFALWSELDLIKYHMTELLYPYSLGFAVHSKYHADILKTSYKGPVITLPLLYDSELDVEDITGSSGSFDGYDTEKINLLTVGNLNHNKRIHSIIETIGSAPELRKNICLTCIGSLNNEPYIEQLNKLIKKHHLEANIKLIGPLEDRYLAAYYKHADIVMNLRYPALEGGSASLVEQMKLGKPVIVSNTGMYGEMPDNCVIKIDTDNEVKDLKRVLMSVIREPDSIKSYGKNAGLYAGKTFSSETYGEMMIGFIKSVEFHKPLHSFMDLISQELWDMGVTAGMRVSKTISRELELLSG